MEWKESLEIRWLNAVSHSEFAEILIHQSIDKLNVAGDGKESGFYQNTCR
jgi:hypothetical protein